MRAGRILDRFPLACRFMRLPWAFYGSEEFQTLLALGQEQLGTTYDTEKLKLLAAAPANSGTEQFRNDDKELMLRALRAVIPSDLEILNHQNMKAKILQAVRSLKP